MTTKQASPLRPPSNGRDAEQSTPNPHTNPTPRVEAPWAKLPLHIIRDRDLSRGDLCVYTAIDYLAGKRGWWYGSQGEIAKVAGVGKHTVQRSAEKLAAKDYIAVEKMGLRYRNVLRYSVLARTVPVPEPDENAVDVDRKGAVDGSAKDAVDSTTDLTTDPNWTETESLSLSGLASPPPAEPPRNGSAPQPSGPEVDREGVRQPLTGWGGQPDETADADAWQEFQQTVARLKGEGITWGTNRAYMSTIHHRGDPPPVTRDDLLGKVVPFVQAIRAALGDTSGVTLPDLAYQKPYSEIVGGDLERNEGYDGQGLQRLIRAAEHWQRLCAEHPEWAEHAWLRGMLQPPKIMRLRRDAPEGRRRRRKPLESARAAVGWYAEYPGAVSRDCEDYAADVAEQAKQEKRAPQRRSRSAGRTRERDLD